MGTIKIREARTPGALLNSRACPSVQKRWAWLGSRRSRKPTMPYLWLGCFKQILCHERVEADRSRTVDQLQRAIGCPGQSNASPSKEPTYPQLPPTRRGMDQQVNIGVQSDPRATLISRRLSSNRGVTAFPKVSRLGGPKPQLPKG